MVYDLKTEFAMIRKQIKALRDISTDQYEFISHLSYLQTWIQAYKVDIAHDRNPDECTETAAVVNPSDLELTSTGAMTTDPMHSPASGCHIPFEDDTLLESGIAQWTQDPLDGSPYESPVLPIEEESGENRDKPVPSPDQASLPGVTPSNKSAPSSRLSSVPTSPISRRDDTLPNRSSDSSLSPKPEPSPAASSRLSEGFSESNNNRPELYPSPAITASPQSSERTRRSDEERQSSEDSLADLFLESSTPFTSGGEEYGLSYSSGIDLNF
ncbi:MAG: hypothetical protein L6R42_000322 [Xanthoria sp. 1 TBL-2021]|nr:MAG: hypothetical protein L6R42_000322 [Xanthoria sp. 1 TBL-2021]